MGMVELLLIAVGLSMDAFAVSACKGLGMQRVRWGDAIILGFAFGLFQALMPVLGYFLGTNLAHIVAPVDHWIVFGLLGWIGGNMVWEAIKGDDAEAEEDQGLKVGEVLALAVATSIDAFATGISFALLDVDIVFAVTTIGITTFGLSILGVWIGSQFGARWERGAKLAGGIVLICIGLKVLLEHLGILVL